MKILLITVSPTGQTQVETKGFTGSVCRQASQFIEQALGRALDERLSPEFHQAATSSQRLREQS
jgi:hypothetical protein